MNMQCIILDDEPKAIQVLERYLVRVPFLQHLGSFRSPLDAMGFLNEQKADLLFLDIHMPELSGLKIPAMLDKEIGIIFTTAYPEHALEGFDLNAIDYLLKPVLFERFLKAVNRANEILTLKQRARDPGAVPTTDPDREILFFKSGTRIHKIDAGDILYFEKEGVYFLVCLKNGKKIIIRTNFAGLMEQLPPDIFYRVHKSYLVSVRHINIINHDEVIIGNTAIPVSDSYRDGFLHAIRGRQGLRN